VSSEFMELSIDSQNVRARLEVLRYPPDFSSEFSQSLKVCIGSGGFVRGSLKFVRGQNDHVQIVLHRVTAQY
jgi:hypothetical protein